MFEKFCGGSKTVLKGLEVRIDIFFCGLAVDDDAASTQNPAMRHEIVCHVDNLDR